MQYKLPIFALSASALLPFAALAAAAIIFVIDTFTPLEIAVAVLYGVVVLMAGRILARDGVIMVALLCVGLAVSSHFIQHGEDYSSPAFVRCLISLFAILVTTFLALKNQSASLALREQAHLLDVTHDAVFVRDMSNAITYWNRGAEELYGWTKGEVIGRTLHQLMGTIYPAPAGEITEEFLRTGRWEGELVHTRRDGTQVHVASRWSLQKDGRGRPVAILETDSDITEQKRAEARTRQQEKELRLAIDTLPAMAWLTRPDGSAEYINKRWLDFIGLPLQEALGWSWKAAVHPDDLPRLLGSWQASVAAGEPVAMEARLRRFDGEYRRFLFRGEPLRDEAGKIIKWYGTNTDIEELKRAEDALRRSEAYLTEAQRLSLTGSFGWNIASGEIFWSDETYSIMQHDPAARPSLELVRERTHPEDRDLLDRTVARVLAEAGDWQLEHRLLMPDGTVKYLRVVARADRNPAGETEYFGAVMDVTAAKRAEDQLQAARAQLAHVNRVTTLGELAASIAHEVNQPIAAVVTNAGAGLRWLAGKPPDLGEVRQVLDRIVKDGTRAGEVIGRIRALVKKAPLKKDRLDINETIREVIGLSRSEVRSHGVTLMTDLAAGLPRVPGDRVQLQQVLLNLVLNAVEAMGSIEDRPRELMITSRLDASGGVAVAVRDSGPGLDAATVDRLFDAFFTTKPEGLGMGLAISRSIIEAHGGRFSAGAHARPGAEFQFSLPAGVEEKHDAANGVAVSG